LSVYATQHHFTALFTAKLEEEEFNLVEALEDFFHFLQSHSSKLVRFGITPAQLLLNRFGLSKSRIIVEFLLKKTEPEDKSLENIRKVFHILFGICNQPGILLNTL
jgi:hypothetical protein